MPLSMKFRYEVGKMDKGMFQNNGHLDKFKQSLRQGAKKHHSENKTPEVLPPVQSLPLLIQRNASRLLKTPSAGWTPRT
jgi:hypothetical protein